MPYRYAGPCSEPKLTQAAAEVRQADLSLMVRVRFHYDKIKKKNIWMRIISFFNRV